MTTSRVQFPRGADAPERTSWSARGTIANRSVCGSETLPETWHSPVRYSPVLHRSTKGAALMAAPEVPSSHKYLLDAPTLTRATIDPHGRPQLSQIWFLAEDGVVKTG